MTDRPNLDEFERRLADELARHAAVARDPRPTRVVAAEAMRLGRRRTWARGPWRTTLLMGLAAILLLPIAALLAGSMRSVAPAPPPVFTATGSLTEARTDQSAALLRDGRVLVIGNDLIDQAGTAELYDTATGTFTRTGSLVVPRSEEEATLLADGRVLVTGGASDAVGHPAAAELFDPDTGTFSLTGSMIVPRVGHAAILLRDGRVLVAGGQGEQPAGFVYVAELYDPATGSFAATGPTSVPLFGARMVMLPDGRVLLVGDSGRGLDATSVQESYAVAQVFDPATGSFTPGGRPMEDRWGVDATALQDGRVLITGGADRQGLDPQTELYDPLTDSFSLVGAMPVGRVGHTAALLEDGRVLVAGGASPTDASAALYDPGSGTWTGAGAMITPRSNGATATLLRDGRLLIAGGRDASGEALADAELFGPAP